MRWLVPCDGGRVGSGVDSHQVGHCVCVWCVCVCVCVCALACVYTCDVCVCVMCVCVCEEQQSNGIVSTAKTCSVNALSTTINDYSLLDKVSDQ